MKWFSPGSNASASSSTPPRDELTSLISRLLDNHLDEEGEFRLGEILENDPEARLLYMQYIDLQIELSCQIDAADGMVDDNIIRLPPQNQNSPDAPLPYDERPLNKPVSHRFHWWGAVAAAAVVSAGVHIWLLQTKPKTADPLASGKNSLLEDERPVVGSLGEIAGNVNVTSDDAQPRMIERDSPIHFGDTIHTLGVESSADFSYPDGTTINISGDTSLTFLKSPAKALAMTRGHLRADVAPQPAGKPMMVQTPQAQIHVIGTVYTLEAQGNSTVLTVTEGVVRLTHVIDGESVEVDAGEYVIADGFSKLDVKDIPGKQVTWSSDFDTGDPAGWTCKIVTAGSAGLPGASKGAARAIPCNNPVAPDAPEQYRISTPLAREKGLFEIEQESHLRLSLRMERPETLVFRILARPSGQDKSPALAYGLKEPIKWGSLKPGEWYTVTIPLSSLVHEVDATFTGDRLSPAQLPVQISLAGTTGKDPDLVMDRMWITGKGPKGIQIKIQE